jgi:hypothetical protein
MLAPDEPAPRFCKEDRCWNAPEEKRLVCRTHLKMAARKRRGVVVVSHKIHTSDRSKQLFSTYGIDEAEWWLMLEAQEWACLICSRPWSKDDPFQHWHVDHNHETGKVRGILCTHCNLGLGHFRDNPQYLKQAAVYLANS